MNRFEDLAPIIAPKGIDRGSTVGFRQGVVESWNPLTAQNTVRIGGTVFADLPVIASSTEVLLIGPGDVVGIDVVSGSSAFSTMYVRGRITEPGTPQAGSFMELFGAESATVFAEEDTGSDTFTDLATLGPDVTVTIGRTGRCLVFLSASITAGDTRYLEGFMSVASVSGPTVVSPTDVQSLSINSGAFGDILAPESAAITPQSTRLVLLSGLLPGTYVLRAKYRVTPAATDPAPIGVAFRWRNITALPF